jgi:hypothetical protein
MEKFSTQVAGDKLAALKALAKKQGRQLQSLVDEAITDVIEKHNQAKPRAQVMAAHRASMNRYAAVYKKLAE